MHRRTMVLSILTAAFSLCMPQNIQASFVYHFPANGEALKLTLRDHIRFPAYHWPRTLLNYRVDFSEANVRPDNLAVINVKTGTRVPCQVSDTHVQNGCLLAATISFFSDLPSGGEHSFVLTNKKGPKPSLSQSVRCISHAGMHEIDIGTLAVRLPVSCNIRSGDTIPGPILALNRGNGWIGESRIHSPRKHVLSLQTVCLDQGDLYQRWRITYLFEDGGKYVATIKLVSGYEFIEFHEEMQGLDKADGVLNEMIWSGFQPTYRFGTDSNTYVSVGKSWPRIDENIKTASLEEDPTWDPGVIEDVSEEMWMYLSPYSGNGVRELFPCVSFWDDRPNGDELGVFVLDYKRWFDHEYGIWQPTRTLMVRFRYRDGMLSWRWPLITGTRSTGINLTGPKDGQAAVKRIQDIYVENGKASSNVRFDNKNMRLRYNQLLQQIYGPLCLDRVKEWVLEYPENARRPENVFGKGSVPTADELEELLFRSSFVFYPLGQNSWPGINSIQHRFVYAWATDAMARLAPRLTAEQRKRIDALLLTTGYLLIDDAMHPIRHCLAGCPNMAADGWCVPMQIAYLYPEHPMATEWSDYYQRYWSLSHIFYTRPDVPLYESKGGRWTESLSVYNWAHLRPTLASQTAGMLSDGINRWATPQSALRGRWLVDMLTAPIHNPDPYWRQQSPGNAPAPLSQEWEPGQPFDAALGFQRQYPAHGAHGSGTTIVPPKFVNILGHHLRNYAPLTAENLMWVKTHAFQEDVSNETDWSGLAAREMVRASGTRPSLASCKYTGHGIVLRAGVGTPEEMSIHLDQVDRGPNYRWGCGGRGASGSIYFYAGGNVWTGHEREDAGDHDIGDTEGVTNFGVMKDGTYRCIGRNVLERPLIDLEVAQFAEATARQGKSAYSWPEYESRSIMLVGTDYFLIYDKCGAIGRRNCRFTWFVPKDGEFPKIAFLKPAGARQDHWREILTPTSKGFHRDAGGSHLTFVTHKHNCVRLMDMQARKLPFLTFASTQQYNKRSHLPQGVYQVETPTAVDTFFRDEECIHYQGKAAEFEGTAGVIRRRKDGALEMAVFHKGRIAADNLSICIPAPDTGVSLVQNGQSAECAGVCYSRYGEDVEFDFGRTKGRFYIDGERVVTLQGRQGAEVVQIPAGRHRWQYTTAKPKPIEPQILRTTNVSGATTIYAKPVAGAEAYLVEISNDAGKTWREAVKTASLPVKIGGLTNGHKIHVRLTAMNSDKQSYPSHEYPVYVTDQPPEHPDGLMLKLGHDRVELSWGQVLGVTEYRLYRRRCGGQAFERIYSGLDTTFVDGGAIGVVPHAELPGSEDNCLYEGVVYEYAVCAVNGNGESKKSEIRDTNPTSWLNWLPNINEVFFRRDSEYWKEPYVPAQMVPPSQYPSNEGLQKR